jgi:hypothetical protein
MSTRIQGHGFFSFRAQLRTTLMAQAPVSAFSGGRSFEPSGTWRMLGMWRFLSMGGRYCMPKSTKPVVI